MIPPPLVEQRGLRKVRDTLDAVYNKVAWPVTHRDPPKQPMTSDYCTRKRHAVRDINTLGDYVTVHQTS